MNIITKPYGSKFHYIRPDISYNKDWNDYFCPDNITELAAVPFIYIRIEKAGKAIAGKFAQRYYSSIGYGIRLSAPQLIIADNPASWWLANSLDLSTYLSKSVELNSAISVINAVKSFPITSNTAIIVSEKILIENINTAISGISQYSSLKVGDYIAIEIAPENTFIYKKETQSHIKIGDIEFSIIW